MTITFDGISIAGSGMQAYQTWLDAIADNIANINTITATDDVPFQEHVVEVQARKPEAGVAGIDVVDTAVAETDGRLVYDPSHPLANGDGFVVAPSMNLEELMTDLIIAQRSFQANSNVLNRAASHMNEHWRSASECHRSHPVGSAAPVTATQKPKTTHRSPTKSQTPSNLLTSHTRSLTASQEQQRPVTSNH